MAPDIPNPNARLIEAYFRMVRTDAYEAFAELITPDCAFSLMPIGRTFRGADEVMAFVLATGGSRRHDDASRVEVTNWFATADQLCVEYQHRAILKGLGIRLRIDGYCLVMHMRDGRFDRVREYINPSRPGVAFITAFLLRLLPLLTRRRLRSGEGTASPQAGSQ